MQTAKYSFLLYYTEIMSDYWSAKFSKSVINNENEINNTFINIEYALSHAN